MFLQIRTIAYYTILEGLRNRILWLVGLILLCGIGLTVFLGELAITEQREMQVALLAVFLRFSLAFLVATFVVTSMVREFNDKSIDLLLALPISRSVYLLGKLAGFTFLAVLPSLACGVLTLLLSSWQQSALWSITLGFELWLVAGFSLLCAFTFNQTMTALSTSMAFYLLGRSISVIHLIGHGTNGSQSLLQRFIAFFIDIISTVMPHLDQFARTEWLVYRNGTLDMILPLFLQASIYLTLLSAASLFDLHRRNV
ncbi:ABC transporter permease [Ampullimonas aquatilis]|uniref:ABC transporter permease n=1 Tax=Ampullimonas aquatilis TaxID=1341549 RepID=UPI003C734548